MAPIVPRHPQPSTRNMVLYVGLTSRKLFFVVRLVRSLKGIPSILVGSGLLIVRVPNMRIARTCDFKRFAFGCFTVTQALCRTDSPSKGTDVYGKLPRCISLPDVSPQTFGSGFDPV